MYDSDGEIEPTERRLYDSGTPISSHTGGPRQPSAFALVWRTE